VMNQEQVLSLARGILIVVGGLLTWKNVLTDAEWQPIAGGLLQIVGIAWGLWSHTQANSVATVAAMDVTSVTPDGKTITLLTPALVEAARAAATPPKN
jgi:hypothetical protein